MNTQKMVTVAAILVTGTLVACGGSSSNEPDTNTGSGTDTIDQYGMVSIVESVPAQTYNFYADFMDIANPVDNELFRSEFMDTPDTCTIDIQDTNNVPDENLNEEGVIGNVTSISAGDVITVSSPAGSFTELLKSVNDSNINYQTDISIPIAAPLPVGLVMDIPGEDFPAFGDIQVPEIQSLVLTSPTTGQIVTTDTEFTWQAGSNSDTEIQITVSEFSDNSFVTVYCAVQDDGSFSFPAATKASLGDNFSATADTFIMSRFSRTFLQQGNAMLILSRTSYAS